MCYDSKHRIWQMDGKIRIVCYGDSNTWGFDPVTGKQLPKDVRWPGVMQQASPHAIQVIEEGLNGRTVLPYAPRGNPLNGAEYCKKCVTSHAPIDFLIVFLGINDLFQYDSPSIDTITSGLERMIDGLDDTLFTDRLSYKILLLPPLPVNRKMEYAEIYIQFVELSETFSEKYASLAEQAGALYVDISHIIESSPIDGIHIDADEHIVLGEYVCDFLRQKLSGDGVEF